MNLAARLFPAIALVVSACTRPQSSVAEQVVYCGGETDVATVERYFSDLRRALDESAPPTRFNAFVDETFGITEAGGRTLYFKLENIGAVTPARISIGEWQEISRRGARNLSGAGWRGCFMDSGKVSFVVSREDGFRLNFIQQDVSWEEPTEGDLFD